MILLIDNYDSFSYNLYQLIGEIEPDIRVIRNDEMTIEEIARLAPDQIILSPGPGRPEEAGIITEIVTALGEKIPILGVCLGHQAVCAAFGAVISYAGKLMHGKTSDVKFDTECPLFRGCPENAPAARYHSLAAKADSRMPENYSGRIRRRNHGSPAQRLPCLRCTVSSRICHDAARKNNAR